MDADSPATPPNPRNAAINAITKKMMAARSIIFSSPFSYQEAIDGPEALTQCILMRFNQLGVTGLVVELEKQGYHIEKSRSFGQVKQVYAVQIPGLDRFLDRFGSGLPLNFAGAFQRFFWSQAELVVDTENGRAHIRWVYWTPGAILQHGLVSALLLTRLAHHASPSVFLSALVIGNLLPALISLWEVQDLQRRARDYHLRLARSHGWGLVG
jgi:hypothetical protein